MAGPPDNARNHSYNNSDNWEAGDGRMASTQQTIISLPGGQKLVGPPNLVGNTNGWVPRQ